MDEDTVRAFILLPYIWSNKGVCIGNFRFKAYEDFLLEPQDIKDELNRIKSFFRQKESRSIDVFNYLILDTTNEELTKILNDLRRTIEVYRFLSENPEGKGLTYEHLTIYVVVPDKKNPFRYRDEEHYTYRATENFSTNNRVITYPHAGKLPSFYQDIHYSSPPHIDEDLFNKLLDGLAETDLRAMLWYNKTYSVYAKDSKENLLRLSVAFESFFSLDEKTGKELALKEIKNNLEGKLNSEQLTDVENVIKDYIIPSITKRLGEKIREITGSTEIEKWFKNYFYSVGSGIRHGSNVAELPQIPNNKERRSIWYGKGASQGFLNNVYFGIKLFKFLLEDRYYPLAQDLKEFYIQQLEELLISDEARLKVLEQNILGKKIGQISSQDIRISSSFRNTYLGSKLRIFKILQRLLLELENQQPIWGEISEKANILICANLTEEDIKDRRKFDSYISAIIDINDIFYSEEDNFEYTNESMKLFYIKQFEEFALNQLM